MDTKNPDTQAESKNKAVNRPVKHSHKIYFRNFLQLVSKSITLKKLFSALIFIAGIAIPYFLKTDKPYIYTLSTILVFIVLLLSHLYAKTYNSFRKPKIYIYSISLIIILLIGYATYRFVYQGPVRCENPQTLREYYECIGYGEYKTFLIAGITVVDQLNRFPNLDVEFKLHTDFKANSCHLYVYIPLAKHTVNICEEYIAQTTDSLVNILKTRIIDLQRGSSEYSVQLENLTFSRRVFLYHETPLFKAEKERIMEQFKKFNLYVIFCGTDFEFLKMDENYIKDYIGKQKYYGPPIEVK